MPTSPYERDDLPRADRVIAAGVAEVYRVIDEVDRWPAWVSGVVAPARATGDRTFEASWIEEGKTTAHRVAITARGPVHTLYAQVDDRYRPCFQTRPAPAGTHVELVAEPLGKPSRRFRPLGSTADRRELGPAALVPRSARRPRRA